MPHTVTSFHSANVQPAQLSAVMADYVALERAWTCRRLFVKRFGLLAFIIGMIGLGLHLMSPSSSWIGVALCAVAPRGHGSPNCDATAGSPVG